MQRKSFTIFDFCDQRLHKNCKTSTFWNTFPIKFYKKENIERVAISKTKILKPELFSLPKISIQITLECKFNCFTLCKTNQ